MTPAEMRALAVELRDVARRAEDQAGRLEGLADREDGGRGVRPFAPPRVEVCPVEWCGGPPNIHRRAKVSGSFADFCSMACRDRAEAAGAAEVPRV